MARCIDVVVENTKGSRHKFEYDWRLGRMRLTRRVPVPTGFPAEYGFLPDTLSGDGDPLDALVVLEEPTFPGCVVSARPVGMLLMSDEEGTDPKIVCAPPGDPAWDGIEDIDQVPRSVLAPIEAFFSSYKSDDPELWSETMGYAGRDEAWAEIDASIRRRQDLAGAATGARR
jgi:inorganic pyrophosphatase